MKYYYTYLITNTKINKFYHGKHTCKCHPLKEFGITYFSSSTDKEFMQDQIDNPHDYEYTIMGIFSNAEGSSLNEAEFHEIHNVRKHPQFYNKHNSMSNFDTTGFASAKDLNGESLGLVLCSDLRWKTGEIVSSNKGFVSAKDLNGKLLGHVSCNDPRWKTGELLSLYVGSVGTSPAKDLNGKLLGNVSCNDTRWLTGEIVGISKGNNLSIQHKKKISVANTISQKGQRNSSFGTHIYINPVTEEKKRFRETQQPEGWVTTTEWNDKNRQLKSSRYGYHWYNDGAKNYLIHEDNLKIKELQLIKKRI